MLDSLFRSHAVDAASNVPAAGVETLMHGDTPGGPIRWRMFIPVAPERVFEALSTDAGRMTFWAESSREEAGHIRFVFANGQEHRTRVIERVKPARFSLE